MRFFQQLYEQSEGSGLWAVGSLLLFLLFFGVMLYFVLNLRKDFVEQMKHAPLHDDSIPFNPDNSTNHE